MNCVNCQIETSNPKFCSRSCSVAYNNKTNPKRKLIKRCKYCDNLMPNLGKNRMYCRTCIKNKKNSYNSHTENSTLNDVIYKKHGSRTNAYSIIRGRARTIAEQLGIKKRCKSCGYDKHVEVCHKTPISSYSLDTKLNVINHPDNLVCLCPNCHWEFDHHLLKIE